MNIPPLRLKGLDSKTRIDTEMQRQPIRLTGVVLFFALASIAGTSSSILQDSAVLAIAASAGVLAFVGRDHLIPPALIVATCFTQVPIGVLNGLGLVLLASMAGAIVRSISTGSILGLSARPTAAWIGGGVIAVLTMLYPPTTSQGQFVALETVQLLLTAALIYGFKSSHKFAERSDTAALEALFGVALAAGFSAIVAIRASPTFYGDRQISTIFGGSNYVAALAAVAAVICFSLVVSGKLRLVFGAVLFVLLSAVVLATASRTSSIVLLVVCAAVVLFASVGRKVFTVSAVLILGPLLAQSSSAVIDRLSGAPMASLLTDRIVIWNVAWEGFVRSPFIGMGVGHLTDELVGQNLPNYAHNIVFSVLAQAGLVGLLYLLLIIPWRSFEIKAAAAAAGCCAVFLISLFEPAIDTQRLGTIAICISWVALAQVKE